MEKSKMKVIVFDLDGTLYQDTHHFDFFAKKLRSKLNAENQALFWETYLVALDGGHPLKMGRVFDVEKDLILVQEHNLVQEAYDWDGNPLSSDIITKLYSQPITIDQMDILSIGDLWWLAIACARHFGLSGEGSYQAFLETRSYMMSSEFVMQRVVGYQESILGLKKKGFKLVLLTNSPEQDSEVILSKLGFENLFDLKIFEGQKPTHTADCFSKIREHFQVDFSEIVSIGDNWINEILPATELGCSTILIDSYLISSKSDADHVVGNISELIPLLNEIFK